MIWSFYKVGGHFDLAAPWTPKPVQMIQQETAITLAHGGNITLYENPQGLRNGRLVDWRMRRLGEVKTFVKARQAHCQHTETVPQVAVLHSEVDFFAGAEVPFPDKHKALGVQGAIYALLDLHFGVDVLDEWALQPDPDRFPVIVAPEVNRMSGAMVERLKAYVVAGGALVVSGAAALARFGADFFGVQAAEMVEDRVYFLSEGTLAVDVHSRQWALLTPGPAEPFGALGTSPLLTERLTGHPAAVIHHHGAGLVAFVPYDVFEFFGRWHYPLLRQVIGRLMQPVTAGRLTIRVIHAPLCVDLVLRRRNQQLYVHAINRASGIPNSPQDAAIDEVPPVGPVVVEIDLPLVPVSVAVLFETAGLTWAYEGSTLRLTLERVHLHAAVLVECRAA
jgi:hypothetical protein